MIQTKMSAPLDENAKRLIDQALGIAHQKFSEGKIEESDEGDLAIAMGLDPEHKLIRLEFGKAVKWIGLPLVAAKAFRDCLSARIAELEKL